MASVDPSSKPSPDSSLVGNPYAGHGVVGIGMTGLILMLDDDRVVKVPKVYPLDNLAGSDREDMEYVNEINLKTLRLERSIYDRLGKHHGIITCFKASDDGIELAYAKQGNLEEYIRNNPEPPVSVKSEWTLALTDTLSYVHSRRVLVDEIALRNVLVADGRLQLADFGQSILLPLDADIHSICENDLNAKIEMLHLGWIIYSIAVWRVCRYYYFDLETPTWPNSTDLPPIEGVLWEEIIAKCWKGEYDSMAALNEDTIALMAKYMI